MQKYVLRPPTSLFSRFTSFIHFESSAFMQTSYQLENIFGAKPDLIKTVLCPGYHLFKFIRVFFTILKVSFASLLKKQFGIYLNGAFVFVLHLYIYLSSSLSCQWIWNSNKSLFFHKSSR